MDIVRAPKKKTGRYIAIGGGIAALALATWGLSQLKPAAPSVELLSLLTDSVRRGDVVREVRGPGNLVAERILFLTPQVNGRVEKILALSGERMTPGQVIFELTSPEQQIATQRAQQQLRQEQLNLATLKNNLQTQRSTQEVAVASARTGQLDARNRAQEADSLLRLKLISTFEARRLQLTAEETQKRYDIAVEALRLTNETFESQLAVAAANVEALKTVAATEEERLRSLIVRAPEGGMLQQENLLQPGQWVQSGQTIAKIVQTDKLKAVLRIPESQAKDVQIGQPAAIDTRNGIIAGHVSRKDASAVGGSVQIDVALDGALPANAIPDLSVDGTIQIELLKNVLYTQRPVSGAATGSVGMFKMVEGGKYAVRTTVTLGRSSVNTVEIISGLQPGDRVILSDMSAYDDVDRVRIK
jgi:multidrug efflux pump subunit AcrA (membrane-fusion protein)